MSSPSDDSGAVSASPVRGSGRWFVWLFAREGLSYLSYLVLAPVIVSYAVFLLGTLGFVVVSGLEANESMVESLIAPLIWLDTQYGWIEWLYDPERTFRANALRTFGMISVAGYLGRTLWMRVRGLTPEELPFKVRLRRAALRLGVFTIVLVIGMATAVMSTPWADDPPFWQIVLQSWGISALMGLFVYAGSLPALALAHGLREVGTHVGGWISR